MNLGFALAAEELKTTFQYITPMDRPLVANLGIKDPNWIAGFTDGDGYFG